MGGKRYRVRLRKKDLKQLKALVHKGVQKARVINRARILLMANESIEGEHKSDAEISKILEALAEIRDEGARHLVNPFGRRLCLHHKQQKHGFRSNLIRDD